MEDLIQQENIERYSIIGYWPNEQGIGGRYDPYALRMPIRISPRAFRARHDGNQSGIIS